MCYPPVRVVSESVCLSHVLSSLEQGAGVSLQATG